MSQVSPDRSITLGKKEYQFEVSVTADVTEDHSGLYYVGHWSVDIMRNGKTGKKHDVVLQRIENECAEIIDDDLIEAY